MPQRRLRAVPSPPTPAGGKRARAPRKAKAPRPIGPPPEVLRAAGAVPDATKEEPAKQIINLGGIYRPIERDRAPMMPVRAARAEAGGALVSPQPASPEPLEMPSTPPRSFRRRLLTLSIGPLADVRRRWRALTAGALALFLFTGVVYLGPVRLTPLAQLQTAFLFDRDGEPLGEIRPEQNRVVLDIDKIPKKLQDAFVAAEDERFWSHPGIDPIAIVRALGANAHGDREGASTITQQYVKNTYVGRRRTLWRKIREAIVAVRVDRKYSKEKILEEYMSSIYLGNGAYGVEAAARLYFGRDKDAKTAVGSLSIAEMATLAGITANPTRWDPRTQPAATRARRDYVLSRMRKLGFITASEHAEAKAEPLTIEPVARKPFVRAPMFQDWLRRQLESKSGLGARTLYTGGLQIKTSLDWELQTVAQDAVKDILNRPGDPDATVVTIDVATGGVMVMVGGRDRRLGDFNIAARGKRQAGSAFKPFVLATALEEGKTLATTYRAPGSIRLKIPGGVWKVSNFDHRGRGRLSLRSATAGSVNTVFAQLILDVGPENVADMADRAGIKSHLSAVPSLALGTSGVSALEMASAYSTFARSGQYLRPTGIAEVRDRKGHLIAGGERSGREVMSPDVAEDVLDALRTVVRSGTGKPARVKGWTAWGKTGTTEDHADAWFVGGVGSAVTAVWVGYPSGRKPMRNVHGIEVVGSSFPAQIWKRVMTKLLDKYRPDDDALPKEEKRKSQKVDTIQPSEEPTAEPSEEPIPTPTPSNGLCILRICPGGDGSPDRRRPG